jgi:hypothetical protein
MSLAEPSRRSPPGTADTYWSGRTGAGATHELLDWLSRQGQVRGRRLEYSVGFPTKNIALTSAITRLPEAAWTSAVTADGEARDGADVAEVTRLLDLRHWPAGMRVIVRREPASGRAVVAAGGDRRLALPSLCHAAFVSSDELEDRHISPAMEKMPVGVHETAGRRP